MAVRGKSSPRLIAIRNVQALRALWGAALGALVVVLLHPSTQALGNPVRGHLEAQRIDSSPLLARNVVEAPSVDDALTAGLWMELLADPGAEPRSEWLELVERERGRDPDNAFWLQMGAVIASRLDKPQLARDYWRGASRRTRWDDLQDQRLASILQPEQTGHTPSWVWLVGSAARTSSSAQAIEDFARRECRAIGIEREEDLSWRFATARNGALIRGGARTVETALLGSQVAESASQAGSLAAEDSPRTLLLARLDFMTKLREANFELEATEVEQIYEASTGWAGIISQAGRDAAWETLARQSTLHAAAGPVAFLALCFGLAGRILGALLQKLVTVGPRYLKPLIVGVAVGLGILGSILTWSLLPALAWGLAAVLFVSTPKARRSHPPEDLGAVYRWSIFFLGMLFLVALFWAVSQIYAPTRILAEAKEGGSFLPGFAQVHYVALTCLAAMVGVLAAVFAHFIRIPIQITGPRLVRDLGQWFILVGVGGIVLGIPLVLLLDINLAAEARSLFENEPLFFFNQ